MKGGISKEIIDIKPNIYIVKKNDDLDKIAKMFNMTVCELIEINNLKIPKLIYPGQLLIIEK